MLTAGQGQNPARQAAIKAGVPSSATAFTINQVCGSGLRAVALGMQQIATGDARVVVAGGQESMSRSPHCQVLRSGTKMGPVTLVDTMLSDGLTDAFGGYHMGITAENVARRFGISREAQDQFALGSQRKAAAAQGEGSFDAEIVPITIKTRKGDVIVDRDEHIRADASIESLAGLKPAFDPSGTVTAGNASGLNDGAAALVLMHVDEARRRGLPVAARIAGWATAGVDPDVMGTGPIPASRKALAKAGWTIGDLDLIEANEAFAAQALAVVRSWAGMPAGSTSMAAPSLLATRSARRRTHPCYAPARDGETHRTARPRNALHRRRDGHRAMRRAALAASRTIPGR